MFLPESSSWYFTALHSITLHFSKIAGLLKDHYDGKPTSELHADIPSGTITHGEKGVRSEPITLPNHESTCYINGRFDIVITFDDDSYGVVDFKTSNPHSDSSWMYSRQLHAYAYSLEHPAPGKLNLSPVTKLGLLYFYPDNINQQSIDRLNYSAEIVWKEVVKNEEKFLSFIDGVLSLLELPEPPECSPTCRWCGYLEKIQ
ncbi:PD-(D/E)XK nuclease family protein [Chloroflexota bacterium]